MIDSDMFFICERLKSHYDFKFNETKLSAEETTFIEFAVSCVRARWEIECIKTFHPQIVSTSTVLPFNIICKKYLSDLEIFLIGNGVVVNLHGQKIFEVSYDEFTTLTEKFYDLLNLEYTKNLFDLRATDAIYLEHMLGADLPYFTGWEYDVCRISDLKIFDKKTLSEVFMKDCDSLEAMRFANSPALPTNFLLESNEMRFRKILSSIMTNGYPHDNKFIIVYNDEMTVRDGTRRLSCLYFLYGDIEIPIMRLKFSFNNYSYSMLRKKFKPGEIRICT